MKLTYLLCLVCLCSVTATFAVIEEPIVEAEAVDLATLLDQVGAMKTEGLPRKETNILEKYYRSSFGEAEEWAKVQSMRFEGQVRLANDQVLHFHAYMKKPNLCKIVIHAQSGDARYIMGYDGEDAWQSIPGPDGQVVGSMPELEAQNFIRDAWFGGHLLYPNFPEKQIHQVDLRKVDGETLVDLEVTLPDELKVLYTISLDGFYELSRSYLNQASGARETIENYDYRAVGGTGVQVPFRTVLKTDGVFTQEITLDKAEVNRGVLPWMFERP